MSVEMTLTVDGFDDLFKRMDEIREEIGKGKTDRIWRKALTAAMEPVLIAAKAAAPKDSGQMADHIYMKVQKPQAMDKAGKYYQGEMYMARVTVSPVRDDTKYGMVLNKRGRFQTVLQGKHPIAVSQEFGNARTPAHPFLRVSLERNAGAVMDLLAGEISAVINRFDKGLKV